MVRICLAVVAVSLGACGDNGHLAPDAGTTPDAAPPVDAMTPDAPVAVNFTEGFAAGTQDIGNWGLTTNTSRPRTINATGGNPDGYLYGEVATSIPTWGTTSTRFQPGNNDDFKRDSIFVGDYYANDIRHLGADLQVFQVGSWTEDRGLTLHLLSWNTATDDVAFDAFYVVAELPDVPTGWNHFDVAVDARSTTVPAGWQFTRGDGTPGTDADWATFMHQIDVVGFGLWKPDFAYPSLGLWQLGIDNIHIGHDP